MPKRASSKVTMQIEGDAFIRLPDGTEIDISVTPSGATGTVILTHANHRVYYNGYHMIEWCWNRAVYKDENIGSMLAFSDPRAIQKLQEMNALRLVCDKKGNAIAIRRGYVNHPLFLFVTQHAT
jgi:hypothetical protein